MKKNIYLSLLCAAACSAVAATLSPGQLLTSFTQPKAQVEQAAQAPARTILSVPPTKAFAWAMRDGNGRVGLVSFRLNRPDSLTLLHEMPEKADAGCYGADDSYYFFRCKNDTTNAPIAFSKVDLETGKITDIANWSDASFVANDMTFDYSTGMVYAMCRGIYNDEILDYNVEYSFILRINPTNGQRVIVKSFMSDYSGWTNPTYLTLAADLEGNLYSVSVNGVLVRFDKNNDYQEEAIGSTGVGPARRLQDMEFDHNTEKLYWEADFDKKASEFYQVDVRTGRAAYVGQCGKDARFAGLRIPFDQPHSAAPGVPRSFTAVADPAGALSTALQWVNPICSFDGTTLGSLTKVSLYRNDELIKEFTGVNLGDTMTYVDAAVPAAGNYTYTVTATNRVGEGAAAPAILWVGRDVPTAVTKLGIESTGNGAAKLTWVAPTIGAHEGYIDTTDTRYRITRMPDGTVLADDVQGNTYTDATITSIGEYYYIVTSRNSQGDGEQARSASMFVGSKAAFPYTCDFATKGLFMSWTVVDNNADGTTWFWKERTINRNTKGYATYEFNSNNAADDYLISPDFYLQKGATYVIKFNYSGANTNYTESFDLTMGQGKTAAAQSTVLRHYDVKTADLTSSGSIVLPEVTQSGIYNIAFHCTSAKGQHHLYITDFEMTETGGGGQGTDTTTTTLTAPFNLKATVKGSNVKLVWNENGGDDPNGGVTTDINENFEGMDDFTVNPRGNHGWTYIDGDHGIPYYSFFDDGTTFTNAKLPAAAIAFNPAAADSSFLKENAPYGGEKYLLMRGNSADSTGNSRKAPAPDNWLISPRLNYGKSFIMSFMAKSDPDSEEEDPEWKWDKEKVQIGFSTTGTDSTDFHWVTDAPVTITSSWKQYTYSMPAEARYVCLRHMTPSGGYWLAIDNLYIGTSTPNFSRRKAEAKLQYFQVYLDGKVVAKPLENTVTLRNVPIGDHTASVTALYDQGESSAATVQFTVSRLTGDINGDGVVNVDDVTELVNVTLGLSKADLTIDDLDGDGVINVTDITELVQLLTSK